MRFIAGLGFSVLTVITLGAQSSASSERVVSVASRTFVDFDTFISDVSRADVLFLNEHSNASDVQRLELAIVEGIAARRADLIMAFDAIDRAAQDPLDHFQMGHLSDQEFVAQSRMPAGLVASYLPLMKLAIARTAPIVATGPSTAGGEADMGTAIVQAMSIGSSGSKRPVLASFHTGASNGVSAKAAAVVKQQLAGHRVLVVRLIAVPSLESLTASAAPAGVDYVIYVKS